MNSQNYNNKTLKLDKGRIKIATYIRTVLIVLGIAVVITAMIYLVFYLPNQPLKILQEDKNTNINKKIPTDNKVSYVFNKKGVANPKLICQLMGEGKTDTSNGESWTSDMGVMFYHQGRAYFIIGDTTWTDQSAPRGAKNKYVGNALAQTADFNASDCLDLNWNTKTDGSPQEFYPKLSDYYTTTANGAISIDGTIYIFMLATNYQRDFLSESDPLYNHLITKPFLIKSTDNGQTFALVWTGVNDDKLINISPILAAHPTDPDKEVVYLFGTGDLQPSPIYLAMAAKNKIEDPLSYQYFTGMKNNQPQWNSDKTKAVAAVPQENKNDQALLFSVQWNNFLNNWLLFYFRAGGAGTDGYFRMAASPWGPWSDGKMVYSYSQRYDWYQKTESKKEVRKEVYWNNPYGGYMLSQLNQGSKVYLTISLYTPYNIFLVEIDLKEITEKFIQK